MVHICASGHVAYHQDLGVGTT